MGDPAYTGTLRGLISRVDAAEARIRDDLLVERVARAHGFKRSGRLIRDRVMTLARASAHVAEERGGNVFVRQDQASQTTWDQPRYPASSQDVRDLANIALPELTAVLRGCGGDDPMTEAARALGVRRLSAAGRARFRRAVPTKGHLA